MSTHVVRSLEDIIKKKRENTRAKRGKVKAQKLKPSPKMPPITDARNKIISKSRTQITDAREKLVQLAKQKDARLKLDKLHQERARVPGPVRYTFPNRGIFTRAPPTKERLFTDSSRQVVSQPLTTSKIGLKPQMNTHTYSEVRSSEKSRLFEFQHKPKPLLRTVENDLDIMDDPMGGEYIDKKVASLNRVANLQLKIITQNNDFRENSVATIHRTIVAEKKKSPPRPPSILNKLPMATLRSDAIAKKTEKPHLEYKIIVSNLRNTVTGRDIQELFEEVGIMLESRLVRPGSAEVIYQTQEDAQKAVDLYHNRHLDGQPMNCLLVTPRSRSTTARTNVAEKEISLPRPLSLMNKLPMATLRSDAISQKTEKPHLEYKIIVSNLRNTVTGRDIEELFEEVGIMLESRLVRPGSAEVIYQTQEDAQKAVDLYHNRHLDGQPLSCLLVTPRSRSTTARSSNKPEFYSTHSSVEPDISIFHKVLFRNL